MFKKIAIIGGGYSGTILAVHLLNSGKPFEITIFDPRSNCAHGVAYSTTSDHHLLNVPAAKMSAFPDMPNHFAEWLEQQGFKEVANQFMPRKVYGRYLKSIFEQALEKAPSERFTFKSEEVLALERSTNQKQFLVKTSHGSQGPFDVVILACGHSKPSLGRVPGIEYAVSGWSADALKELRPHAPIILIGSGLTALDMILDIEAAKISSPITVISRHGLLPRVHGLGLPALQFDLKQQSLRSMLHDVRRKINSGHNWRTVIDSLRARTQALWSEMTLADKQRFLRHLQTYWDVHRHRVAPSIAKRCNDLQAAGKLNIIAGRIFEIYKHGNDYNVHLKERGENKTITLDAQRIVLCTGPASWLMSGEFARGLLRAGLITPDALGVGPRTNSESQIISSDGTVQNNFYAVGVLRRGELWENIAVPELRVEMKRVAETISFS